MNEIANQHNDLIDLPLRKFNASEIDILMALCYKCQEQGTDTIVLPFDQIQQLSHFKSKNKKELIHSIEETNKKLLKLNFRIGDDMKFVQFVLFPTFEVDGYEETLTVQVHEKFAYLLNDLAGNYTSLELQESAKLRSAYAKGIYKKLRQYRDTGLWRVTLDDFKEYLDIPKGYKPGHISTKVLIPSIEELTPFFPGLKCTPYYHKKSGRGRPSVSGYEFTFKKQSHKKEKSVPVARIATKTNWEKIGKYCPVCHQEVWKKRMTNENGEYWMIGHPDFKTGGCDWTSNNFGDSLSSDDINRLESEASQSITEMEKENVKTLKGILKNIFSQRTGIDPCEGLFFTNQEQNPAPILVISVSDK